MQNREIREHPLGIPVLGDVFVFQSLVDLKTKRVPVDQFLPSPSTQNFEWTSQKAVAGDYDIDSIVTYEGNLYQSEVTDNSSVPGTNTEWTLLTKGKSGFVLYEPGVFTEDDVFTLFQILNAVYIFRLVDVTRPYNSTDFLAEYAAGDWELIGLIQVVVVDTTLVSDEITLDFRLLQQINFRESAQINEAKDILFDNPIEGLHCFFRFSLDAPQPLTFPAGVKLTNAYNAEWANPVWTALEGGEYELELTYINSEYRLKIHGPFN